MPVTQIPDEIVQLATDVSVITGVIAVIMGVLYGAARAWEDLQKRRQANKKQKHDDVEQAMDVKDDAIATYQKLFEAQLKLHDTQWEYRLRTELDNLRMSMESKNAEELRGVQAKIAALQMQLDQYSCEKAPSCDRRIRLGALIISDQST